MRGGERDMTLMLTVGAVRFDWDLCLLPVTAVVGEEDGVEGQGVEYSEHCMRVV